MYSLLRRPVEANVALQKLLGGLSIDVSCN